MRNYQQQDLKMLQLVKDNPRSYRIMVDNDSVWIETRSDEPHRIDDNDCEHYYSFDDYGTDFIIYILNLLGYRAEGV